MKPKTLLVNPLLAILSLMAFTAFAQAQDEITDEEDIYTLSPFEIDTSADDGYVASNTLAGTRLRTSLRDVASSVSVMTPEFLEDIGANDMQDALLYSVNQENEFEFAPEDGEGDSISTLIQTRSRGLVRATQSRQFFVTNLRTDNYNIERLTMARGPNAILFGLGSPAGVTDATLKKASTYNRFGLFEFRVDSNEGHREVLDYNLPLIDERLAVRVALLNQDKRTFRDPEYDLEERAYVTFTARPWKGAVLRGYYETANVDRVKARSNLPRDGVSAWIAEGQPLYDHINKLWTYDNGASWEAWRGQSGVSAWALDNQNKLNYIFGSTLPFDVNQYDQYNLDADVVARLKEMGTQAFNTRDTGLSYNRTGPVTTLSDGSIYPLDGNILGEADKTTFDVDITTFTFEQSIGENLFVELAYNKENYNNEFRDPLRGGQAVLQADVNYYWTVVDPLPRSTNANPKPLRDNDGNPVMIRNPYAGQYFVDSIFIGRQQETSIETARATVSYELDLTEKNKWFGRYNFGGLYQTQTRDDFRTKSRLMAQNDELNATQYRNGRNNVMPRAYIKVPGLSDSLFGDPYALEFAEPADNGYPWFDTIIGGVHDDGRPELSRTTVDSAMFVTQGVWDGLWNDQLIATYGYRSDKVKIYDSAGEYRASNTPEGGQIWQIDELALLEDPSVDISGITRTLGLMYHTPINGVSLFYNKSNTFEPHINKKDVFGNLLETKDGRGEEYGVQLSLLEDRLIVRVNRFTNSVNNDFESSYYYNRVKDDLLGFMENQILTWAEIEAVRELGIEEQTGGGYSDADIARIEQYQASHPDTNPDFPIFDNQVVVTRDYTSEGWEGEVFIRPTDNLDIRLTVAKTEAQNNRAMPIVQDYINSRWDVWQKYFGRALAGEDGYVPDYTDPSQDPVIDSDWVNDPLSIGYLAYTNPTKLPRYFETLEQEGQPSALARKWRVNLVANYRFTEGRLKGFSTGLGMRWRDKLGIGFEGKPNPFLDNPNVLVPDITKPIYGDELLNLDVWFKYRKKITLVGHEVDWTIYLKIANPFRNDPKVSPREVDYRYDDQISEYLVEADRSFTLSNTIKF